jgi:hypothetical protein
VGEDEVDEQQRIQLAAEAAGEAHGQQREPEADREVQCVREPAERGAEAAGGEERAPEHSGGGYGRELRGLTRSRAGDREGQEDPEEEQGGRCEAAQCGLA